MRKKTGNKETAILDSAIKVFAEVGYHNAKISKIAEMANVAIGSVYNYYEDKEHLLIKIFEQTWESLYQQLLKVVTNSKLSPVQKFDIMMDMIFSVFEKNPDLVKVIVNDEDVVIRKTRAKFTNYYLKFMDLGEVIVKEGIAKKMFRKNFDIKILRSLIFGSIRYLLRVWVEKRNELKMAEIQKNLKIIINHGILK